MPESTPAVTCSDGVTRSCMGQWIPYVCAGAHKDSRRERLSEVPEDAREAVEREVRSVFALRGRRR